MFGLHKQIQRVLKDSWKPQEILLVLLQHAFRRRGVVLTKRQKTGILQRFSSTPLESSPFVMDFTEHQRKLLAEFASRDPAVEVQVIFDEIGSDAQLEKIKGAYVNVAEKIATKAVQREADNIIAEIGTKLIDEVKLRRSHRDSFHEDVLKIWADPLNSLTALVWSCHEVVDYQIRRRRRRRRNVKKNFAVSQVQSRAIQVAQEVVLLLDHGFADGAYARWRTLHELAVILRLLSMHGDELAERYIDYCAVEQLKILDSHNLLAGKFGTRKVPKKIYQEAKARRDAALLKHGAEFGKSNAWAAKAINAKKADIKLLEEAAGLDYVRPTYTSASSMVHGNSHGWAFKVGLPSEFAEQTLLLGPSIYGLHVAGVEIARTLYEILSATTEEEKDLDSALLFKVIADLATITIRKFKVCAARFVVR